MPRPNRTTWRVRPNRRVNRRRNASGSSGGGFDAAAWSNLLWWNDPSDAATVVLSGSNVDMINDKSAGGTFDLDNTGTFQLAAVDGKNMVGFGDANDDLHTTNNWDLSGRAVSVFCVVKLDDVAPAAQGVLYIVPPGVSDFHSLLIEIRTTRVGVSYGTGHEAGAIRAMQSATGVVAANGKYVLAVGMDVTAAPSLWVNGVSFGLSAFSGSLAPASFLSNATTNMNNFVGRRTGAAFPLIGKMGDMVGYSDRKSTPDMLAITAALMTKYGIV